MAMKAWMPAACAALAIGSGAVAQTRPPAAIYADPPADKANPARSEVLHIPSGGVKINGLAYLAAGPGAHPTVVLAHGLPGNEKNLDLAQALRRGGWNVVTFNYRGSWGSPGTFSFTGNLDDARAVLAYLRTPENAARLRVETGRLVLMGHSMGGWVTSQVAAADPSLAGAVLISSADMAGPRPHPRRNGSRSPPTTWRPWPASPPKAWPTRSERSGPTASPPPHRAWPGPAC